MRFLGILTFALMICVTIPAARADQSSSPAGAVTAESALPSEHMDDAVKMAAAAMPDKSGIANASAAKNDGENQPLFTNSAPAAKSKEAAAKYLWLRMLASLAIVLTLFGGGLYAFKRWPGSKKIAGRARMIEVLSQHHLGPKKTLAVVRVAGETCLIGVTDNNISILKTLALLDDDVPKESATVKPETNLPAQESLGQKFQKTLAAKFTKTPEEVPAYYTRQGVVGSKPEPEDDFSMQGLREIVGEKLKTMKEL